MRRRYAGFSLLELLIVIAIIGILISLLIPVTIYIKKRARIAETHALLDRVGMALKQYRLSWGTYPIRPGGSGVFIDSGGGPFDPGYYQVPCAPAGSVASGAENNAGLIKALRDSGNLEIKPTDIVGGQLVDSFGTPIIVRFMIGPPTAANQEKLSERVVLWSYGPDRVNNVTAKPVFTNSGLPFYDQSEINTVETFPLKEYDDIIQW